MIKKIKNLLNNIFLLKEIDYNIKENIKINNKILLQTYELEWASIYNDSIRGDKYISNLNINVGRWAGNYAFFYVLYRILSDYRPEKILELGLGESSKLVSTYIKNYIPNCKHTVVEQDLDWILSFKKRFELTKNTNIVHLPIENVLLNDFKVLKYSNFQEIINEEYSLYIIDGPYGSDRYSRNDIINLVKNFTTNDFVIIFDDTHRIGELETVDEILSILNYKNITFYINEYVGNKSVTVIASEKFKLTTTL